MTESTSYNTIPDVRLDDTLAHALGLDGKPKPASNTDHLSFSLYCPPDPHIVAHLSTRLPEACAALCADHIWSSGHPLILSPKPLTKTLTDTSKPHLLESSTVPVAECIDDEWFALWVLKSLTHQFSPHLVLTTSDADGQFVLIETADHLPSWVAGPELVEHRVWWADGQLMLVPPTTVESIETEADGAALVLDRRHHSQMLAPEPMRRHLDTLLGTIEYSHALDSSSSTTLTNNPTPSRLPSTRHHLTHMYLPPLAASLLHPSTPFSHQQLAAFAIHAVHTRDPVSMRTSRDMPRLIQPASHAESNWVRVPVCLTRYLYAVLDSTRVDPIPPALAQAFPANVPRSMATGAPSADATVRKQWQAWHNGAKLALGLEVVLGDSSNTVVTDDDWWKHTRVKVVDYLESGEAAAVPQTWDAGREVDDDDDAWMHVTDEDLQRWSSQKEAGKGLDVAEMVKAVNAFGEEESGLDGVAPPAAGSVTAKEAEEEEDDDSDEDDELLFDPDKFDALFTLCERIASESSRGPVEAQSDSDSDTELDEMMAEHLPGVHGDAPMIGGTEEGVDEMQVLANLLASLDGQEGRMGPAAGLLAHLGFPYVPGNQDGASGAESNEEY